jgi:hypothetical protein
MMDGVALMVQVVVAGWSAGGCSSNIGNHKFVGQCTGTLYDCCLVGWLTDVHPFGYDHRVRLVYDEGSTPISRNSSRCCWR